MASAFSSVAVLSYASPHSIRKPSIAAKSLFKCRSPSLIGPQFTSLDAESWFVACTLPNWNPHVRFLRPNEALVVCSSRPVARAYVGGDSGNTPDVKDGEDGDQSEQDANDVPPSYESFGDGVEIAIEKIGRNQRRFRSKVAVQADLQTVWDVLTDYERLADFIPGLAVSLLLEKGENFARLFQVGEQNLVFGLKFNAKGTLDCFERDLQMLPFGQKRDIDFTMVEGDFQLFEGTWSVEQEMKKVNGGDFRGDSVVGQDIQTTLHYVVRVQPKVWLPVHLVEGRLCKEIRKNLLSIHGEAEKAFQSTHSAL